MSVTPHVKCSGCGTSIPYTAAACPGCKRRMVGVNASPAKAPAAEPESILENEDPNLPYKQCRDCRFWVRRQDEYCPNCGIVRPQERLPEEEYLTKVALDPGQHGCFLLLIYMIVMSLLVVFIAPTGLGRGLGAGGTTVLTMVAALFIVIGAFKLLKRGVGILPDRNLRLGRSLRQNEQTIGWRVKDIDNRRSQIQSVIVRVYKNLAHASGAGAADAMKQWDAVRARLDEVDGTLKQHRARYGAKMLEIEAVRWQNGLTPLLYGWEGLSYEGSEKRLKALDEATAAGLGLRKKLDAERKTLGDTPDAADLSIRIDETLASCKKVHDGLVGRQAVLALKGISPLKDASRPVPIPTSERREMEVFNIQVAISDFSSSFEELEAEYARLQSEEDVAQEVGRIIERADDHIT